MDRPILTLIDALDRDLDAERTDPAWSDQIRRHLHALRVCLRRDAESNDATGGLYADLASTEPRVLPLIERLRADCADLHHLASAAADAVAADTPNPGEVRHAVRELIQRTRRYRSRCDTAMHEAVGVDLGTTVG